MRRRRLDLPTLLGPLAGLCSGVCAGLRASPLPSSARKPASRGDDGDAADRLAESANLQRRAAEGSAVDGGGEVEMTQAECEQLRMLGYVEDCSEASGP